MLKKEELEKLVLREDFLEYMQGLSKEEVNEMLGENFSRMVGYEQKNIHHCYDLYNHTLHTVNGIDKTNINEEELKKLKVAALFHDVAKPDVSSMNEKTGQQVFYGHAQKSGQIADEMLEDMGYSKEEIASINFYIVHHDDFISYKNKLPDYMKTHEFLREINESTIAEKFIENRYDFTSMGLDKEQTRYAVAYLARGEEPIFTSPMGKVEIDVNMQDVKKKMASKEYDSKYIPTKRDYELLTNLCRADAKAQTELYKERGKVLCSRKEKLQCMDLVDKSIDGAYKKTEDIVAEIELDEKVISGIKENTDIEMKIEQARELAVEYKDILAREENVRAIEGKNL